MEAKTSTDKRERKGILADFIAHCRMLERTYDGFDAMADEVHEDGTVLKGQASNSLRRLVARGDGRRFRTRQMDLRARARTKTTEE